MQNARFAENSHNLRRRHRDHSQQPPNSASPIFAPIGGVLCHGCRTNRNGLWRRSRALLAARAEKRSRASHNREIRSILGQWRPGGRVPSPPIQSESHNGPNRRTISLQDLKDLGSHRDPRDVSDCMSRKGNRARANPYRSSGV